MMDYMMDRIIDKQLSYVKEYSKEYEDSLVATVERLIEESGFDKRFQGRSLDISHIKQTPTLCRLHNEFDNLLKSDKNSLILCTTFAKSPFIAASLFEKTINKCLYSGEHIPKMVYVDTSLYLDDMGKLITSYKTGEDFVPTLSKRVLEQDLYTADFVFWDKFNYSKVPFAESKLYSVVATRYARSLNNMFFINTTLKNYVATMDCEVFNAMGGHDFLKVADLMEEYDKIKLTNT